jgi:hypothetical protein
MMERQTPPLRNGWQPFWRAPVPPIATEVLIPSWNWATVHDVPEGTSVVTLDANAAYLGALGNASIAHSELVTTGAPTTLPTPREVVPGYYKITVPYWGFSGTITHPLGESEALTAPRATVWVAAPTLILLIELLDTGHLGDFRILDSYTARRKTTFRTWAERLKSLRLEGMDRRDHAHHSAPRPDDCDCPACGWMDALKTGYSSAFSMMLTGERCQTHRPDWAHTVYAEHAATQWRKAWRFTYTGLPLIRMGAVDELTIMAEDLHTVLARPKPPFRYDASGRNVGAFKPKSAWKWDGMPTEARTAPMPFLPEPDEYLGDEW